MKVLFDTTGIIDVDRQREPTVSLLESLVDRGAELYVSTVTVAETLTGANLADDSDQAMLSARRVLGQFNWIDLDGGVAEELGELLAILHGKGNPVGFQDVAIAASHLHIGADVLVTSNVDHFKPLPSLAEDVRTPRGLKSALE